jgi:uncharacterized protein YbjT (DUF2867 family)
VNVLLTGATGFIGTAVAARLIADGHRVTGVGRRSVPPFPLTHWIEIDLREVDRPERWLPHLAGIDAVVNCAGVLQDNGWDSTAAAHVAGPAALFAACERAGVRRVIQVSAVGVESGTTEFSRTKARGDAALVATSLDWVILRPSVVVGRSAYGGSALFRALASLPVLPRISDGGLLQVVQLDDLVATVVFFLRPDAPARLRLDITGPEPLSFEQVIAAYRAWLGRKPARLLSMPPGLVGTAFRLGDVAGWLGWRSPVRTTARMELQRGAVGDNAAWRLATGIAPQALADALASEPASVQETWFSRLYLLKPLVLIVLSLFWIATGLIALGPGWSDAIELIEEAGVAEAAAPVAAIAGVMADLAIGAAIAFRRTARPALYIALALSLVYALSATLLLPRLWNDPLGPLLKLVPIVALNVVALATLEDR